MIDICFWCIKPKEKGQTGDPQYTNYEPCKTCKKWMKKGITVVQVEENGNKNPPITDNLSPTGIWVVISEENVKKVLTDYPSIDKILSSRMMYVNVNDWDDIVKL